MQEVVPATVGIAHGQIGRFLIEVYAPKAILCIHLAEAGSITLTMTDLIKGRGFVILLHIGLVKVLQIKAYAKGTIRFVGLCKG